MSDPAIRPNGPWMLITAMVLLAGGAIACAVGLLEQQAAWSMNTPVHETAALREAVTGPVLQVAHAYIWSGIVATAAGMTALVVALRERRH